MLNKSVRVSQGVSIHFQKSTDFRGALQIFSNGQHCCKPNYLPIKIKHTPQHRSNKTEARSKLLTRREWTIKAPLVTTERYAAEAAAQNRKPCCWRYERRISPVHPANMRAKIKSPPSSALPAPWNNNDQTGGSRRQFHSSSGDRSAIAALPSCAAYTRGQKYTTRYYISSCKYICRRFRACRWLMDDGRARGSIGSSERIVCVRGDSFGE